MTLADISSFILMFYCTWLQGCGPREARAGLTKTLPCCDVGENVGLAHTPLSLPVSSRLVTPIAQFLILLIIAIYGSMIYTAP